MPRIPNPRQVIDRKALVSELEALVGWSGYSSKTQGKVLDIFKQALATGREEVRRRFEEEGAHGSDVVKANAFLIDQIVRVIHDFALDHAYPVANPTTGEQLSIAAVGGYGRGELAPQSDIDLLFLLPYKQTPRGEQTVEFVLYMLWDLGLKVGHATRSIDDCIRLSAEDLTIRTSLLEARWLWGDEALFSRFRDRFAVEVVASSGPEFVEAKLAERDARHERMGDSRYVVEPNVKEGKGGLRDLQTLFWIAKYLYRVDGVEELVERDVLSAGDARRFAKAQDFLWTVRCHLHYLTGRPEERLTFDVQGTLGERMGYTDRAGVRGVERFMKHYYLYAKTVGDLTRILCAVLEEQHKKRSLFRFPTLALRRQTIDGFRIDGGRVNVDGPEAFADHPVKLLRLFHEAQEHELDIHPEALRAVTRNLSLIDRDLREDPAANRLFMEMMTSRKDPETTLRRLNEAGVFGRFIPDFGRVVAQMQYDMYHVYTVDEHTIRAIGLLARIENGELADEHPVAAANIGELQSRRVLYVAVLLHDIAKGRGGDHSEIGAEIALELCPRLGLTTEETETVAWLVLYHLLMSRTAFERDVDDPQTVADFVAAVQSPERLRLLNSLTAVDIRAVGPGVWNAWKAGLLRELYHRALEEMIGEPADERRASRVDHAKAALRERLTDWPEKAIDDHIALGYAAYWLSFDTDSQVRHANLVHDAEAAGDRLRIETRVAAERDATEVLIYTADHAGLFANIAGAMALSGASIVEARVVTLSNGMALDTFWVQNAKGSALASGERLARLRSRVEDALSGRINVARELEKVGGQGATARTDVFTVPPRVLIDNDASASHTIIEVNGRDRPGFLHAVNSTLTELGLQITSARIATYGERAVDVFYVKNVFGLKLDSPARLETIRSRLLTAIGGADDDSLPAPMASPDAEADILPAAMPAP
jgi:[protein-PII] uridylyltransferase